MGGTRSFETFPTPADVEVQVFIAAGLLFVVGLAAAAAISMARAACRRRSSGPSMWHAATATVRRTGTPPATFGLQVVAVGDDADGFVLDGIAVDDSCPLGPMGWPVAVRAYRPESASVAAEMRTLMAGWAAADATVHVAVRVTGPRRQVSISEGASVLQCELA